jgi:hypothetical protein
MRSTFIIMAALTLSAAQPVLAACVLPVPDGGDVAPSPANLHGRIVQVKPSAKVVVRPINTNKRVTVVLPRSATVYTAFGGDVPKNQLRTGQTAWVWFQNCKPPKTGLPVAAYFQIYSTDPNDQP